MNRIIIFLDFRLYLYQKIYIFETEEEELHEI